MAFHPGGRQLASAGCDGTVRLWDAETGRKSATLRGHTDSIYGVAYSPRRPTLASASWDGTIKLWDAATGKEEPRSSPTAGWCTAWPSAPTAGSWRPGAGIASLRLWDAATGRELVAFRGHDGRVWDVAFRPDGRRLASAGGDRTVKIWDVTPWIGELPRGPESTSARWPVARRTGG